MRFQSETPKAGYLRARSVSFLLRLLQNGGTKTKQNKTHLFQKVTKAFFAWLGPALTNFFVLFLFF